MANVWRGNQTFKGLATFQGGVQGAVPALGNGKTFWVDTTSWGTGSDSATRGRNPNYPLATIEYAMTLCTANNNDYIIVLNGWDNDTTTISLDKQAVHIIGVNGFNHRAPFVWLKIAGTGALPVFTLQGSNSANCEIAGFTLSADASHPCITTAAGGASTQLVYAHIHHCSFGASIDAANVCQDGILQGADSGLDAVLVEDCTFGDEITRDGIRFTTFYQGLIRNCLFSNCGSIAIDAITGGAATGMPDVISNKFRAVHDKSEGWAITTVACGGGLITDNQATADFATGGNNPYLDHADLNQWGVNWTWNAVAAPATT
jgi:hypothetical protein